MAVIASTVPSILLSYHPVLYRKKTEVDTPTYFCFSVLGVHRANRPFVLIICVWIFMVRCEMLVWSVCVSTILITCVITHHIPHHPPPPPLTKLPHSLTYTLPPPTPRTVCSVHVGRPHISGSTAVGLKKIFLSTLACCFSGKVQGRLRVWVQFQ